MSVKDRLDRLEANIALLEMTSRHAGVSRGDIFERIESNADDINTLEARAQFNNAERRKLEARVEELENAEADTRWNAPDNSTKPEKFIKVKNSHCQVSLLRLNNLDAIQSCWDEEEDQQIPGEIIFNPSGIVKSYSDKESWQHDLNKIEWFIYDDALLLDLIDGIAPECTTSNNHDICPMCGGGQLYWYVKYNKKLGAGGYRCMTCNYKES